jgi:surfactin synthase thioesterase subunit
MVGGAPRAADWLVIKKPAAPCTSRLICVPNAGAGVFTFRGWAEALPTVEVAVAHLPGRDGRRGVRPPASLHDLADAIAAASLELPPLPTVVFGHSMGALVAREMAHALSAAHRPAAGLIASGRRAPFTSARVGDIAHLDDAAFLDEVQARYGGIPALVLEDAELRDLFLPTLRSDMRAVEAYVPRHAHPLTCPIVVYGGDRDPQTNRDELDRWSTETSGSFAVRMFEGGHFFIDSARSAVLASLREDVARAVRLCAPA